MKISLLISNPYHVDFFKNIIKELWDKHEIFPLVRDEEISKRLMDLYSIKYTSYASTFEGYLPELLYSCKNKLDLVGRLLKIRPDVLLCINELPPAPFNSIFNMPTLVFLDRRLEKRSEKFVFNYADKIVTPSCYHYDVPGKKRINYPSYPSMIYLHPSIYKPDTNLLNELDTEAENYIVVTYDSQDKGIKKEVPTLLRREKIDIVRELNKECRVFVDERGSYPEPLEEFVPDIPLNKYHDLISNSKLLVSDDPYTSVDAGSLGTPWICVSSESTPCLEEQEVIYEIGSTFRDFKEALKLAKKLINDEIEPDIAGSYERILEEKDEITDQIIKEIESANKNRKEEEHE